MVAAAFKTVSAGSCAVANPGSSSPKKGRGIAPLERFLPQSFTLSLVFHFLFINLSFRNLRDFSEQLLES
jgi:hypothetical protein